MLLLGRISARIVYVNFFSTFGGLPLPLSFFSVATMTNDVSYRKVSHWCAPMKLTEDVHVYDASSAKIKR